MKFDGMCLVTIEREKGETDRRVLTALAAAAYELSEALEPDDPAELFPSRGFLLPADIEPFIACKPGGLQIVMDIAFDRLIMLDVRAERLCDARNGQEDAFVLDLSKYGRDPHQLVERANQIMDDLVRGYDRAIIALWRACGHGDPDDEISFALRADGDDRPDEILEFAVDAGDDDELAGYIRRHSRWLAEEEACEGFPDVVWELMEDGTAIAVEQPSA